MKRSKQLFRQYFSKHNLAELFTEVKENLKRVLEKIKHPVYNQDKKGTQIQNLMPSVKNC